MYETYIHMQYNLDTLFILEVSPSSYSTHEILERTSSVPLEYHYSTTIQNLEKTKGTPVPLEYHYSTSISDLHPYINLKSMHNTFWNYSKTM